MNFGLIKAFHKDWLASGKKLSQIGGRVDAKLVRFFEKKKGDALLKAKAPVLIIPMPGWEPPEGCNVTVTKGDVVGARITARAFMTLYDDEKVARLVWGGA